MCFSEPRLPSWITPLWECGDEPVVDFQPGERNKMLEEAKKYGLDRSTANAREIVITLDSDSEDE